MHQGQLVFAQLMRHLPLTTFRRCVARYAGRAQGQELLVSGSVSVHGVRTTDLSREPARHRGESASTVRKALPLGDSRRRCPQHSRQRQCDPRLAYLRELRGALDRYRTRLVCRGAVWRGSWPRRFTRSTQRPSICVCRFFRGRRFARRRRPSSCIRCSICAAISQALFISPTARCTRSTCSTCCCQNRALTT